MKRRKILLILVSLVLILTSCSSGDGKNPDEPSKNPGETVTDKPDSPDPSQDKTTSKDLTDNPIKLVFFEIGKADAFLIFNEGAAILIDTGEAESAEDIISYMEKKGVDSLDYLFITHFDKDHVGGASRIMNAVTVKEIYTSNYPKSSGEYDNFKSAVNKL